MRAATCDGLMEDRLRFRWQDLPAVTAHLPGTGGVIRNRPEDFQVTEVPSYLPCGEGEHLFALVEKRGLTTMDLLQALRRRGVPPEAIGAAGLKDKYAVTRQWLSLHRHYADHLMALEELEGVRVLERAWHRNKLKIGHLRGNRFRVTVTGPVADWRQRAEAVLAQLYRVGMPNYFGPQRFGRHRDNALDGLRVVRGQRSYRDRRLRRFLLYSLQSHLFNWLLRERIRRGLFTTVVSGDWAQKHDTGGVFLVEDPEAEAPRAARLEISALLPLYGKKVRPSEGRAGELEREVLALFGLGWEDFRLCRGSRRGSRVRLEGVELEATADGYAVTFTLPKGAFATVLLRELMKVEVDVRHLEAEQAPE